MSHPHTRAALYLFTVITQCILYFVLLTFHAYAEPTDPQKSSSVFNAKTFTLKNGLQIVVVENHRVPIVTHMLWVRAGGADEPESVGGVAHFIEHLMFKGTPTTPPGDYSRRVRILGGQDNAFTSQDYTAYFATMPREHLPTLMQMERDRFLHLLPHKDHITSEHEVIMEERRQRTENDPLGPLYEQMNAYLFASTPYDNPVIGWMDDMKRLTWDDAQTFKKTWYTPNNMILILSGDITVKDARELAQKYYGDWKSHAVPERRRLSPPPQPAPATLTFTSDKINQPQAMMAWRVPSYRQDAKTALALQVMTEMLDGGASTPLYQTLVVKNKIASGVSLSYDADSWDGASLWLAATPAPGITPEKLAEQMMAAFKTAAHNMTDDDLKRAVVKMRRQAIFARDSISGPAMVIGQALTTGSTLEQVETWPDQIGSVTLSDIRTTLDTLLFCTSDQPKCGQPLTAIIHAQAGSTPAADATPSLPQTGGRS